MQTILINHNDVNQRIDNFIRKAYPKLSLGLIYRYLRIKRIKVNDRRIKPDYRLQHNDKLSIYINDDLLSKKKTYTDFLLAPNKLDIVYEDKNILLVNKPVGLVVHNDEKNKIDTLINRIQHYLYEKKE
jgi:23S rRNA pseudouridine955/2504/2580 synthase